MVNQAKTPEQLSSLMSAHLGAPTDRGEQAVAKVFAAAALRSGPPAAAERAVERRGRKRTSAATRSSGQTTRKADNLLRASCVLRWPTSSTE
jgi:hypothetical protein